jgi:hypothetical protein
MLVSEKLSRNLGADPRPICRGDRIVSQLFGRRLSCGNPLRYLDAEGANIAGVNLERRAQPGRLPHLCIGQIGGVQLLQPLGGEGMHASAEEGPHLLRRHRMHGAEAINAGHPGADPHPRALTPFGVVGSQSEMAPLGGSQCRDLPGQIVVPRAGAELVDAHRHDH